MREILFRGQRKDTKEWIEGFYVYAPAGKSNQVFSIEDVIRKHWIITEKGKVYEVIPETVGQYTGLTDKNGRKIFEGDILNCYSVSGICDFNNQVVNWNKLFLTYKAGKHSLYGDNGQKYEVIGNIHDNPELLEVKDNA